MACDNAKKGATPWWVCHSIFIRVVRGGYEAQKQKKTNFTLSGEQQDLQFAVVVDIPDDTGVQTQQPVLAAAAAPTKLMPFERNTNRERGSSPQCSARRIARLINVL